MQARGQKSRGGTEPEEAIQVSAGVIHRKGRYLVTRRRPDAHLGGLWEFPGGKREAGESLEACLRRELREELNVEITAPRLLRVIRHDYPDHSVELHFFSCELAGSDLRSLETDGVRWVLPGELSGLEFPPADRSLIEAIQSEANRE